MEIQDTRTFDEIKQDIYEAAALGYDQTKAHAWAKAEVERAYKKYLEQHKEPKQEPVEVEKNNAK